VYNCDDQSCLDIFLFHIFTCRVAKCRLNAQGKKNHARMNKTFHRQEWGPLHMNPVTGLARLPGRILLSVHMGNFSPVDRDEIQETKPKLWNIYLSRSRLVCRCFVDSCNFTNEGKSHTSEVKIHARQKLCHFGSYVAKAKLFSHKSFVPVTRAGCSYGKIFITVTEISKTEISITGPARLLI